MTGLPRALREERMDAPEQDPAVLARSLDQVAAVDRWLGGARAVRHHLGSVVSGRREGRILDVGTGNGRVLARLVAWARRVGGPGWSGVGVDLHPAVIAAAAGAGRPVPLVRGDAFRLPFADGAFDAVVSTLTLHHVGEGEAVEFVREMRRVCRGRVVVSDLERCLPGYLGARFLALTWWRGNRLTRHDGPLSVLRSFTPAELAEVGRRAGLDEFAVTRHPLFRLVLAGTGRGTATRADAGTTAVAAMGDV